MGGSMRFVIIVFLVVCLLGATGAPGVIAQVASPSPANTDDQLPQAEPEPWLSTELKGAQAITSGHGRYVVVGEVGKRKPRATSWTSTDGLTWTQAPETPQLRGAGMGVVTSFGDGFVALGTEAGKKSGEMGTRIVAWYSSDGLGWKRAKLDRPGLGGHEAWAKDVVDGPAGLLALGVYIAQDPAGQRLWRSDAGRTWVPIPLPDGEDSHFGSLTAIPGGYLLGAFSFGEGGGVWMSSDGLKWKAVEAAPGIRMAADDDGTVVAIGGVDLWTSSNLETWRSVWESPSCEDDQELYWVTWDGSKFATTGYIGSGYEKCSDGVGFCPYEALLLSVDGYTWVESTGPDGVPGPDQETYVGGIASLGDSTVVLGDTSDGRTVAWLVPESEVQAMASAVGIEPAAEMAARFTMFAGTERSIQGWREVGRATGVEGLEHVSVLGDRLVAVGGTCDHDDGRCRDVAWHSSDAKTWTPVTLEGHRPLVTDTTVTPDGLVAVGYDLGIDSQARAAAWITKDGTAWAAVPAPPVSVIDGVAASADTIVVAADGGIWANTRESEWARREGPESVVGVATGPGGFLAWAGEELDPAHPTQLWRSVDGSDWTEVDLPEELRTKRSAFGDIQVFALTDGWMLIPSLRSVGDSILVSTDGLDWQAVPRPRGLNGKWARWVQEVGDQVLVGGTLHGTYVFATWAWRLGEEGGRRKTGWEQHVHAPVPWQGGLLATGVERGCPDSTLTLWRWDSSAAAEQDEAAL